MRARELDAIFRKGHKKFGRLVELQISLVLRRYAVKVLRQAVTHYMKDKGTSNLTGNTIAGFSAGIYVKGKCIEVINVLDIDKRLEPPTSGYTTAGESGFADYDTGEYIGDENNHSVKPYKDSRLSWQPTQVGGSSIENTAKYLRDKKPDKNRIFIYVANVSPYVEWLYEVRNFDILESVSEEGYVRKGVMKEIERIRPIDVFEKKL